jgi:hypothetical protein
MKYKFKLLIVASVLFCLSFAQVAGADNVLKTLYIDGNMVSQVSADACSGLTWPSTYLFIGVEGGPPNSSMYNQFVGKMDEFTVYSGVLSAGRIAAHYAAKDSNNAYTAAVAADIPKLWLKFNDADTGDSQTALNSGSATGKDGTYISTYTSGSINKVDGFVADSCAVEFVGKSTDGTGSCIRVADAAGDFSALTNGDVSIEFWVNFADANDYPRFFQHNGSWTALGAYGFAVSGPADPNQGVVIGGGIANYMTLPYYINDANWHHIVVTYDSTYVPLVTGLYESEVLADTPVLYLRFSTRVVDPCDPNLFRLVDSSGNNNWAVTNATPRIEPTVGSEGNAIYLNGGWVAAANRTSDPNNNPPQYGHQYSFSPVDDCDITFEFWLKDPSPDSVDAYACFFNQCPYDANSSAYNSVYSPRITRSASDGVIFFGDGRNGGAGQGGGAWCNGAYKNTDPNWHYYVVEYNSVYVNGQPNNVNIRWFTDLTSFKNSTYPTYNAQGEPFWRGYVGPEQDHILIGNKGDRFNPGFNPVRQYMDEFAIYRGLLSPGRMAAHYAAWQPHSCAEIRDRGLAGSAGDMDVNCKVNFKDFAMFALNWASCNDPTVGAPTCPPNW